jgi:radical SAM protein with 4Fe4S-binding SPASM domain
MILLNELRLSGLIKALSLRRIGNILKTSTSFLISALINKPVVWGIPPVLTIEPTNQCNLHCPLCTTGSGEMERSQGRMSLDTFKKIIDHMGKDIFFMLIYHQGEPYMNKDFFKFVELAKQNKIYVTTSTNGHYFTDNNIHKTLQSGLDSMIISLDGTTQKTYEKYRVGGNLERVLDGTARLVSERRRRKLHHPNIALQFLVMKHNEHEIPEVKRIAEQLQVDRLLIKNIEVRSLDEANDWLPSEKKFRRYDFDGQAYSVKGLDKNACTRPWLSTLINWDGTFVPCCFDKNGTYPMGDIHNISDLKEMWTGKAFTDFRSQLLQDRKKIDICRNCNQGFGSFLPSRLWKKQRDTNTSNSKLMQISESN